MEFDFSRLGLPGGRSSARQRAQVNDQLDELDVAFGRDLLSGDGHPSTQPGIAGGDDLATWLPDAADFSSDEEEEADTAQITALAKAVGRRGGSVRPNRQSQGPGPRDWEDEQQQLFEKELAASRRVRLTGRRKRGTGDGIKRQPVSREVGELLARGNGQVISDDWIGAKETFEEVIRIDPIQRDAWLNMAMVYEQTGDPARGLQARILGAHLGKTSASAWVELASLSEERLLYRQAAHCYAKAAAEEPEEGQWKIKQAIALEQVGEHRSAARLAGRVLAKVPFDYIAGRVYVQALVGMGDRPKAILYLEALARWNMAQFPYGEGDRIPTGPEDLYPQHPTYGEQEITTLADLHHQFKNGASAIDAVRQGVRWLTGRGDETFWDAFESDDREFDEHQPRVPMQSDDFHRMYPHRRDPAESRWDRSQLISLTTHAPPNPLPPAMRLWLARARLDLKHTAEATLHLQTIIEPLSVYASEYNRIKEELGYDGGRAPSPERLPDFPGDVVDFIPEIAAEFRKAKMWPELLNMSHVLSTLPETNTAEIWSFIGKAEFELGQHQTAYDTLSQALEVDPRMLTAKLDLARASEALGYSKQAMQLVGEVMAEYEAQAGTGLNLGSQLPSAGGGLFDEAASALPAAFGKDPSDREVRHMQVRRERDTVRKFDVLAKLQRVIYRTEHLAGSDSTQSQPSQEFAWWRPDVRLGTTGVEARALNQYLSIAESLVEQFTANRALYTQNKKTRPVDPAHPSRPGDLDLPWAQADQSETPEPTDQPRTVGQEAGQMLNRLENDLEAQQAQKMDNAQQSSTTGTNVPTPSTYAGVLLDDWVDMFINLAFVLTKQGRGKAARAMIDALNHSNAVWTFEDRMLALGLARIASALYDRDASATFKGARSITGTYMFHEMPVNLWLYLANALGFYGRGDAFSNDHRRYFKRRNGTIDWIASGRPHVWNERGSFVMIAPKANTPAAAAQEVLPDAAGVEYNEAEVGGDSSMAIDPALVDPTLMTGPATDRTPELTLYHQRLLNGRGRRGPMPQPKKALVTGYPVRMSVSGLSFEAASMLGTLQNQGAVGASLRALTEVPTDPLLNLLAGTASIARTEQRQVDNRHQMVLQGLALISRSHQLGGTSGTPIEAYNLARAYQGVSLSHLAADWYERCLALYDAQPELLTDPDHPLDVSREAAFNLSLLYTQAGNHVRADALYDRWLTV